MTDATDKRYQTMLAKYGSPEAVAAVYRANQAKSRKNYKGGGGFAALKQTNPDKLRELSKKAGKKSAAVRWNNLNEGKDERT